MKDAIVGGRWIVSATDEAVADRNVEVTWREYQRGVLAETGIAISPTAAFVFKQCDGERTLTEIVKSYQQT